MRFRFGELQLDDTLFVLSGPSGAIHVEPQVFELLRHLILNHDRVVSKEELLDTIWGDRFVSESALTSRVKAARRAVGDDGKAQRVIKTIHARGYQFVAEVRIDVGRVQRMVRHGRRRSAGCAPQPHRSRRTGTLASVPSLIGGLAERPGEPVRS